MNNIFKSASLLSGQKSCAIWSSAGPEVQLGSSFTVYCTFNCKCKGSMYSGHPPTLQSHKQFNSTTVYVDVVNITKNRTFSCECSCLALDPCGVDIFAGCEYEGPVPHYYCCSLTKQLPWDHQIYFPSTNWAHVYTNLLKAVTQRENREYAGCFTVHGAAETFMS